MEISTPDGARLLNPSLAQLKLLDLLSNEFGSPCASWKVLLGKSRIVTLLHNKRYRWCMAGNICIRKSGRRIAYQLQAGQKVSLKVDEFINVHLGLLLGFLASPPHHCTRLSFTRQELQRPWLVMRCCCCCSLWYLAHLWSLHRSRELQAKIWILLSLALLCAFFLELVS